VYSSGGSSGSPIVASAQGSSQQEAAVAIDPASVPRVIVFETSSKTKAAPAAPKQAEVAKSPVFASAANAKPIAASAKIASQLPASDLLVP
jgi:hypothetical protein